MVIPEHVDKRCYLWIQYSGQLTIQTLATFELIDLYQLISLHVIILSNQLVGYVSVIAHSKCLPNLEVCLNVILVEIPKHTSNLVLSKAM